jgi:hypothetical protein
MTYFLATMVASGIVIVAGWRSKHARRSESAQGQFGLPDDHLWGESEIDLDSSDARADVGGAIRLALKRLAPVMASQAMKVDVAAPSGLFVRMRGAALANILEELLAASIHGASGARLLLTAATHGERIYVSITDDMRSADPTLRAADVRGLMERVALLGGSLEVDVRPAEGTTMTLRLAMAVEDRKDRALPEPVKGAAPPLASFSSRRPMASQS